MAMGAPASPQPHPLLHSSTMASPYVCLAWLCPSEGLSRRGAELEHAPTSVSLHPPVGPQTELARATRAAARSTRDGKRQIRGLRSLERSRTPKENEQKGTVDASCLGGPPVDCCGREAKSQALSWES